MRDICWSLLFIVFCFVGSLQPGIYRKDKHHAMKVMAEVFEGEVKVRAWNHGEEKRVRALLSGDKLDSFGLKLHGEKKETIFKVLSENSIEEQTDSRAVWTRVERIKTEAKSPEEITEHSLDRPTVALCLATRDESVDLYEWIEYHKSIGVSNVIIVENNSSKASVDDIYDFINSGFVYHYVNFQGQSSGKNNQIYAYDYCLQNFKRRFTHMGFLDTDEFVVLKNNSTIIDLIGKYRDYGGLALNWMFIGSNNHINRPSGGILANYNQCMENYHVKSIVNMKYVAGVVDPHSFRYIDKYYAVDTNFNRVDGPFNPPCNLLLPGGYSNCNPPSDDLYKTAFINHYILKSKEDFEHKHVRGSGDGARKPRRMWSDMARQFNKSCEFLRVKHQY